LLYFLLIDNARSLYIIYRGTIELKLRVLKDAVFLNLLIILFSVPNLRALHAALLTNLSRSLISISNSAKIKAFAIANIVKV
jgi:hypothetical protein